MNCCLIVYFVLQDENMTSSKDVRAQYKSAADYEDDFM